MLLQDHALERLTANPDLYQQVGRSITWDAEKHVCVGDDEATKLLKRPAVRGSPSADVG